MRNISKKGFEKLLLEVFSEIHSVVTGSQMKVVAKDVKIFEEHTSGRRSLSFYLYHGTERDRKRVNANKKSCWFEFKPGKNVVRISHKEGVDTFNCDFGYVLYVDRIFNSMNEIKQKTHQDALEISLQLCVHEIRHEMQLIHKLKLSKQYTEFPGYETEDNKIDWNVIRENARKFYEDAYVAKKHPKRYLARELDAIIASYMALHVLHSKKFSTEEEKMQEIARIIRGD